MRYGVECRERRLTDIRLEGFRDSTRIRITPQVAGLHPDDRVAVAEIRMVHRFQESQVLG